MSRIKPALRRAWFLCRGGERLNGSDDELTSRGFHLLLTAFLSWFALVELLVIPLFAIRKVALACLFLVLGGVTVAALILLRRGRKRTAATLFLSVLWCVAGGASLLNGGVRSVAVYLAFALSLDAAWLLGPYPAIGLAATTLVLSFVEALLEHTGHPLPFYFPGAPMGIWAIQVGMGALAVGPILAFLEALRKQVSALRDSEERFHSLSDASLEGIMIHDQGMILDTNLAFARLFGYERPDELLGRNALELLLTPESRARIRERLDGQETGVLEVTGVRRDGATFPAETESRAIRHHGRDARIAACRDITDRKRAIEAQIESEERYRALFERSLDCVILTNFEGHLLDANKATLDLLGYRREDIGTLTLASLLSADQLSLTSQRTEQILADGYMKERNEYRLRCKDGQEVFIETQASLIYRHGKPVAIQSIGRDITERKRAEEEKAKLQAQLNQAQKMESIGRLAGGVAHDFNNLLTVINGYSDVLMHQLKSPVRKYAEQINKAGESAASLTRQLLSFSRMEATNPESVPLNRIVAESQDMLGRLLGEDIEMKTNLQSSSDEVLANPNQIHQCLMNLVVNACDAMPAGGQLTIETGDVDVSRDDFPIGSHGTPGPHVRLTVRDTGIGMDQETSQRIFEPFFTTKEKGRGTGLGLSTVYGIVRHWQGFLTVRSVPGRGSEFSIYLPLNVTIDPLRKVTAADIGTLPAASETVLVVEDQEIVREFVVESLRMHGYEVLEARNGLEALQIIERNGGGIDLMMTDMMMPGMGGKELAARARVVCPSIKVLFMTGYADASVNAIDWPDGKEGKADIIMKPFVPEAMAERVRGLLHPRGGVHKR